MTAMKVLSKGRLAVAGVVLSVLVVGSPPAVADSAASAKLFTGGGRGPTAAVAIQSAIDDAETSAAAEQLYTCALLGEPQVFESFNDPNFGHVFRAEATVSCTP
ncbi:hypothetical protein [Streptomyces flavofungini]|uniref:hypothetical protein n=1 Tax=Streptomyces flavofungini TaxID=68200 RepID=UPI0025AFBA75|nr:hypothetical protein [Streptomyces flavofungini]WJV44712.1 hypothetical protein QUY26_03725 [Streptomyces flavofungini]